MITKQRAIQHECAALSLIPSYVAGTALSRSSLEGRVIANIRPAFQPIVTANEGALYAYEALLRLPGILTSDALFRRWESTGDVAIVDATMVRRVRIALATHFLAHRHKLTVSVNVSALTVALSPKTYLAEIAALTQVAKHVIVEVTETFPVLKFSELLTFAMQCKQLGASFALDDCTPHHEFCHPDALRELRPAILKIDGKLLTDAHAAGDEQPVCAILDLAADIGACVVAEHVANESIREWSVRLGAHLLQGFHFGVAKPLARVPVFVK